MRAARVSSDFREIVSCNVTGRSCVDLKRNRATPTCGTLLVPYSSAYQLNDQSGCYLFPAQRWSW